MVTDPEDGHGLMLLNLVEAQQVELVVDPGVTSQFRIQAYLIWKC